jgi:hypothetical protein
MRKQILLSALVATLLFFAVSAEGQREDLRQSSGFANQRADRERYGFNPRPPNRDTHGRQRRERPTSNVYATYRLKPTLNISTKYRYGSNFPAAAFLIENSIALSEQRNRSRLPVQRSSFIRHSTGTLRKLQKPRLPLCTEAVEKGMPPQK